MTGSRFQCFPAVIEVRHGQTIIRKYLRGLNGYSSLHLNEIIKQRLQKKRMNISSMLERQVVVKLII